MRQSNLVQFVNEGKTGISKSPFLRDPELFVAPSEKKFSIDIQCNKKVVGKFRKS